MRKAIVDALQVAYPEVPSVLGRSGDFNLREVLRVVKRTPSLVVTYRGGRTTHDRTANRATVRWYVYVLTTGDRRDAVGSAYMEAVSAIVPANRWGIAAAHAPGPNDFRPHYSRELDEQGVALFEIAWEQAVDLVPVNPASIDDFLTMEADWVPPDHTDDTPPKTDEITLPT
jgi:phage gp37-like protein